MGRRLSDFDSMDRRKRERLRLRFFPAHLKLLFVGESPPASGRFFSRGDSGLYRAVRDAFRAADPLTTDDNFLSAFKDSGCYLVDLCPDPVDRLGSKQRRAACRAGELPLSRTIARLSPVAIVIVVRSIEINVARAAFRANWHGTVLALPYPGRWSQHRNSFIEGLAPTIRELILRLNDSGIPARDSELSVPLRHCQRD